MASKKINITEIYKRCPPNQVKQFLRFRDKCDEYKERVQKYPEELPRIDWDYYRTNVRGDFVRLVDEFESKYKELNEVFDSRTKLDLSKYYVELEKVRTEVQKDMDDFIAESNKRISKYEEEIKRVTSRKPYNEMTMEDFHDACPEHWPLRTSDGQPTFWPHFPDEQTPGIPLLAKENDDVAEEEKNEKDDAEKETTKKEENPNQEPIEK